MVFSQGNRWNDGVKFESFMRVRILGVGPSKIGGQHSMRLVSTARTASEAAVRVGEGIGDSRDGAGPDSAIGFQISRIPINRKTVLECI